MKKRIPTIGAALLLAATTVGAKTNPTGDHHIWTELQEGGTKLCRKLNLCKNDPRTAQFLEACTTVAPIWPGFSAICNDLAAKKKPEELRPYLDSVQSIAATLQKMGPALARGLILDCTNHAVEKNAAPSDLLFCLNLKSVNLDDLAKGKGSQEDYARLVGKTRQPAAQYPTGNSQEAEQQRSEVRKALVYGCINQGEGYMKAVCAAIATHEMFASRPFGSNGELVKAFDAIVKAYAYANAPQEIAKGVLKNLGIPEELLETPDRVNTELAKQATNAGQAVADGADHVKKEVNKILGNANIPIRF